MQWVVLAVGVVLALLMVSSVKMFSLKFDGVGFSRNAVRYVFLLMAFVIIVVAGIPGVGLAVVLYVLSSLVMWLAARR